MTVGSARIGVGETIVLCLSLCNRDARVFEAPLEMRFDRAPNPHLAFAHGAHYCLGAALARVELSALLEVVLRELADLRLVPSQTLHWSGRFLGRGLDGLLVTN
jgi:cytochrome P450